ncbi:uncharacterized protein PGTG_01925 [Puccinia graminis f. sp. tritici CRL 75-36-700-3]|uniref:Uncharacterized protein n=1 Tax=Puccinia graminis f. sp. tritici (strain CRL 75-36-700-3 / race SCCL) TaxID=418459 RepID=E3JTK7_PUCGT|nr:uncharacterized protein PGTG_01925 [Puccinia graminis f. sp. tritici CRL 75-36-700-3]EFP75332.1 hypothetical protein PGTG_01925 [Puccinia graminis f. sp. tritici CRL 75-36-700-3]
MANGLVHLQTSYKQDPIMNKSQLSQLSNHNLSSGRHLLSQLEGNLIRFMGDMTQLQNPINCIKYSPNQLSLANSSPNEFNNISSREVLVEILAVALDQWDLHLICLMGASSRTTINPNLSQSRLQHEQRLRNYIVLGRSFFGKVLEVGKAVKNSEGENWFMDCRSSRN